MSYLEICALLVREPFQLRLDEIKQLDRWTVSRVYFHVTDERTGAIKIRPKPKKGWAVETDDFTAHWLARGMPAHRIGMLREWEAGRQERWLERREQELAKLKQERKG